MNKMKIIITLSLFFTCFFTNAQKKEDKRTMEWRYEIQCAGIGADGYYLIKIFTYSTKKKLAMEQAKKNAVHGILFKGFAADKSSGCGTQKPICSNPNIEFEKKEFFDTFFADGGAYMKFVSDSSDGNIDPSDCAKVGKEYKMGVLVSVNKNELRKNLEAAGIIRNLKDF
jgi:hypothetical protein